MSGSLVRDMHSCQTTTCRLHLCDTLLQNSCDPVRGYLSNVRSFRVASGSVQPTAFLDTPVTLSAETQYLPRCGSRSVDVESQSADVSPQVRGPHRLAGFLGVVSSGTDNAGEARGNRRASPHHGNETDKVYLPLGRQGGGLFSGCTGKALRRAQKYDFGGWLFGKPGPSADCALLPWSRKCGWRFASDCSSAHTATESQQLAKLAAMANQHPNVPRPLARSRGPAFFTDGPVDMPRRAKDVKQNILEDEDTDRPASMQGAHIAEDLRSARQQELAAEASEDAQEATTVL
eukprot:TRINITY_DN17774_c0_g1_i1.p1 TRINITY_DN17774_c0_g1~~TRINITY_DN17774_c0_g1_i1.p1  ORF type:complete len:290 (-),score=16.52 TRINITY_DN17774_c0_g1_i1:148-1017(-)